MERLNKPIDADFRISAPSEGSFLELVQLYRTPVIQDVQQIQTYFNIPFVKMLPWVLDKVLPKSSSNERLADIAEKQISVIESMAIAQQETAQDRERTVRLQIREDTERLRIIMDQARSGDGVRENLPAAKELSGIVRKYGTANKSEEQVDPDSDSHYIADELFAEANRAELITDDENEFDEITIESEQKIVERTRKTMPDLGFPLKRSSSEIKIEVGNDNVPIAAINERRLRQIISVSRDDNAIRLVGNIVRLDKDHGFGRFRPAGTRSPLSFVIPREIYHPNKEVFIAAFGASEIMVEALPFRDGIGNITKLLLLRVV